MDLTGPWIDDDDGTAFAVFLQDLLADALEILVDGGDHVVPGDGGMGNALRGLVPLRIVGDMDAARLALELEVKGLLDALAPLTLGEDQVLVLNRTDRERGLFAGVADDVRGEFPVWIETGIDLLEDKRTGEPAPRDGDPRAGRAEGGRGCGND